MAHSVNLGTIVTRCQQRSDKENDGSVSTSEWKSLISELYGELHAIVSETGCRQFETEATIAANGASSYALPSDHFSTIGVDYVVNTTTGQRRELDELMTQERIEWSGRTGDAYAWSFTGTNLRLYPTPSTGTYKHLYVPQPTDYSASADDTAVDLLNIYGEKFVVWGVASIAQHKGEKNQLRAVDERDRAREEVINWATKRALLFPRRRVISCLSELGCLNQSDWRFR